MIAIRVTEHYWDCIDPAWYVSASRYRKEPSMSPQRSTTDIIDSIGDKLSACSNLVSELKKLQLEKQPEPRNWHLGDVALSDGRILFHHGKNAWFNNCGCHTPVSDSATYLGSIFDTRGNEPGRLVMLTKAEVEWIIAERWCSKVMQGLLEYLKT